MSISRISTFAQNELLRARIAELQGRMAQAQSQIASGKKAETYSGLGADALGSISLNSVKRETETYRQNVVTVRTRMETMQQAFTRIDEIASEMRAVAMQAVSDAGLPTSTGSAAVKAQAAARLQEVIGLLNSSVDGIRLFAGRATATVPMPDPGATGSPGTPLADVAALDGTFPLGSAASGATRYAEVGNLLNGNGYYYQGDSAGSLVTRVADGFDLQYGIPADHPAVREVLQGLYALATTDLSAAGNDGYRRLAELVSGGLESGRTALAAAAAELGAKQAVVEGMETHHDNVLTTLQVQIGAVEDVDLTEAASRLTQQQTLLEASYRILAMMRDLNLARFL